MRFHRLGTQMQIPGDSFYFLTLADELENFQLPIRQCESVRFAPGAALLITTLVITSLAIPGLR